MTNIIEIKNLSKKYSLYHKSQQPASSLRDVIASKVKAGFNKILGKGKAYGSTHEEFWALQNINLQIKEGDSIGIIGKNGAGKSTLLKILSRITEPTTGSMRVRGRIAALLEIGTGFHPDLSGRENIFLSGAILGMKRREIKQKFDEIVAFAEIEKFLDTPVKHFSSGMYTRLGFSIAAHLEPDILIVDEVLAVGDSAFQEKCLKKINSLGKTGRTVLFVSHNMSAVMSLCQKGLFLEKGKISVYGAIQDCVSAYAISNPFTSMLWQGNEGDEHFRIYKASITSTPARQGFFHQGDEVMLELDYEILQTRKDMILGFSVWNSHHQKLAFSRLDDYRGQSTSYGAHHATFLLDSGLFHEGEYYIKLHCSLHNLKNIISDEIVLKLPIYPRHQNDSYKIYGIEKEGISLGNKWRLQEPSKEDLSV